MPRNKDSTYFDVIVIGIGSMGAPACYFLAKRGYRVLGIEQFDITHEKGSHGGQSRIIRKAYFEDPGYVPLLSRAYENWKALEDETGETVYHRTGLAYFGKPDTPLMEGVKRSAALYNIPLEITQAASSPFSLFQVPSSFEVLYESDAGFVRPERSISLYARQAVRQGASIHTGQKVLGWKQVGKDIAVTTSKRVYHGSKLIVCAGAWAGQLIPGFSNTVKASRQVVAWIKPVDPKPYTLGNFPCWMIADEQEAGVYYGFPFLPASTFGEPAGLKLAWHYPGEITDPDQVNREVSREEIEKLKAVMNKYLPGSVDSVYAIKTCLYGNSPDEHFIIDKLPGHEETITVACGFSGHGFKFASVVGEILADLSTDHKTSLPIGFLNAKRFGLNSQS